MDLTITVHFEVCCISDTVMHVLKYLGLCSISDGAISIANAVIVFNSALNPFAYALINKRFREKMKGMLCGSSYLNEGNINADRQ